LSFPKVEEKFFNLRFAIESAFFGQIADFPQMTAMKRFAEHSDDARIRHDDAYHHADRGRLTGAVRSDETEDLPFSDREGKFVHGDDSVVGLADAVKFEGWHAVILLKTYCQMQRPLLSEGGLCAGVRDEDGSAELVLLACGTGQS